MRLILGFWTLMLAATVCFAWSGHQVTEGDLSILIDEVPDITERDTPIPVNVTLTNAGGAAISGTLEVRDMVDDSRVVGEANKPFSVPAGGTASVDFAVSFGEATYSALYPVHVYADFTQAGEKRSAHAVRIVTTKFAAADVTADEPTPMEQIVVPARGAVGLWTIREHRVTWGYYDEPLRYKPAGWMGSDAVSRANFGIQTITRGEAKPAIHMHPPWVPGGGAIYADYLLKLPDTEPLTLSFANAIRDHSDTEPASDGVLFRVWAAEGIAGENAEQLYENFTDAKVWAPGEADLTKFAGKTILLRLESHPGPDRNTTCDSSYWAEPTVVAGQAEIDRKRPTLAEAVDESVKLGRRILAGDAQPDGKLTFVLGNGDARIAAVIKPTERGIVDGFFSLVGPKSAVTFDGLNIDLMRQPALRRPSSVMFLGYSTRLQGGRAVHEHRIEKDGEALSLTLTVWAEGDGLRIKIECAERITDFSLGAADQKAPVVYYGHGYRIVNPKGFGAGFGGHNLATSHVGCDFAGGMSLLQAVDVPPNRFEVSPESNRYALHSHMNGTLTLVPSEAGAFDCALKYRPLYDKQPAGGVRKLAGRFCFDIWGGRYGDDADRMERMVKYGLTDSFITKHVWQRWGYDYRLPDIWPPDPRYGTLDDLKRLGDICRAADIPWGLHDNYIDFYPDAEEYSYDDICFTESGQPIKAWLNEGREAQSYRWRPDRFMPFLQRNLKLIKEGCAPTHYFIDVFTSIGCIDFYDRKGSFHPSTETGEKWGEAFAWIRDFLGDDAPTTSEAGHDQLTGYLDGADCQHLTLTDKPRRFMIHTPCDDWERVPWFDAVNHSRFILHGVGYSGRYQGGRPRSSHGINSDDYISAEVLEGHALMVDAGSWGRPAVRKYWLAQDIARRLALKEITNVEFVDGDMHRQIVTWSDGTNVHVNRGEADWTVDGRVLPQYGYLVTGDGLVSAIEKRDGVFCESTVDSSRWYCNARTFDPDRRTRIRPRVEDFEYLGDRKFRWDVVWQAEESAPRDLTVFVHFYSDRAKRRDKIAFQDDHQPTTPTSNWQGEIRYSREISVPEDAEGEYTVGFGLYDSRGRLPLTGPQVGASPADAIWVGTLTVKRQGDTVTDVSLGPPQVEEEPEPVRLNLDGKPVDFGFAVTDGAFRVQRAGDQLTLTPLPDSPAFDVTLRLSALGEANQKVVSVTAIDHDGSRSQTEFTQNRDAVSFRHDGRAFSYEVDVF